MYRGDLSEPVRKPGDAPRRQWLSIMIGSVVVIGKGCGDCLRVDGYRVTDAVSVSGNRGADPVEITPQEGTGSIRREIELYDSRVDESPG